MNASPSAVRALAIVGAAAGALLVWFIAQQTAGDLQVKSGSSTQTVGAIAVVVTVVFAGLVGWGLLALLERFAERARTIWTVVAVLVLLLSLIGPLGGTDAGTKVSLVILHLLVGSVIITAFTRTSQRR